MNENASYAFELEDVPRWKWLPAGPVKLGGWFIPKNENPLHDFRIVIGRRIYLARHGLLRPELLARFPQWPRARHAGFEFTFETGPGDHELRLEFLNEDLQWVEFWRRPLVVQPFTLARPVRAQLNPDYLAPLLQRELQARNGTENFDSPFSLEQLIPQACTAPSEWTPAPPVHASMDIPRTTAIARYHLLHVCGWAFHETLRIRRLYATSGVDDFHAVKYGLPQDGVERHFGHFPYAKNTMFFALVSVARNRPNPLSIKVYAEFEDGSHHMLVERRIWATSLLDAELPLPRRSLADFISAAESIHHRIGEAGARPGKLANFIRASAKVRHELNDWFSAKPGPYPWESLSPHERQLYRQAPSPRLLRQLHQTEEDLHGSTPSIGLIAACRAESAAGLTVLVRSLRLQVFRKWELLIVPLDEPARQTALRSVASDSRISIAAAKSPSESLGELRTDYVAFVDPGAEIRPEALLLIAEAAIGETAPVAIYTDEETIDSAGKVTPWHWPDWSPAFAFSGALGQGLVALQRSALASVATSLESDWQTPALDGLLRITSDVPSERIHHLARSGIRQPARTDISALLASTQKTVQQALARRNLRAEVVPLGADEARGNPWMKLQWSPSYLAEQPVTIVIPTRDRLDLLQRCIQRLEQTLDWRHVRLLVVDDGSRKPKTVRFLAELAARSDLPVRVLQAGTTNQPFNYSRLVNLGTQAAETPLVLHLNNDVDALEPGWLEAMVGWFALPETGAVGAKLVYSDGRINHAGIVVSSEEALAFTPFEGLRENDAGFPQLVQLARDSSAVIGACLLTRTDLYRQLNGFNETEFGVAYNDVDYCLRLRAAGWRTLYVPQARLIHWGSESRGRSFHESEHLAFLRIHGQYRDPCFNPQLKLSGRTLAPDLERPNLITPKTKLRLLVASHNLGLEGAPLFLFEFVEHAIKVDGFSVDLIAFADGPLRAAYENLGVRITIVDRHPVHGSRNREEYEARVGAVRRSVDLSGTDLVVANTVVGFWIIELARQAGLPSLWFIHESARIPRFFSHELMPGMQPVVHAAFREATRVVFLCEATRRYYDEDNVRDHFRILPGWVDARRVRTFKAGCDRAALRKKHGIGPDDLVVINVGTVCERKGQHDFIPAARRLAKLSRKKIHFLMIGGLNDMCHELLENGPALRDFPEARIVSKTDAVYEFYAIADLAVCTSYEESFPRVLLEAMAFEVPVVSTDVHGVPEIITDRTEGWLVKPGDIEQLSRTMLDALAQSRTPNSLAPMALSKVMRRFDCRRLIPRHIDLAREASLG